MKQRVALVGEGNADWQTVMQAALPGYEVAPWLAPCADYARVEYAVGWVPPPGVFTHFPHLKAVFVLGAGVDRFVERDDLPPPVRLIRLTDAGMAAQMIEYVLYGVLRYQRFMDIYERQQALAHWHPYPPRLPHDVRVSVLGLGEMGGAVADALAGRGYAVTGWSRSAKVIAGVRCLYGSEGLNEALATSDVLVNILPSTPTTRGLLNRDRLTLLPVGAGVINSGRGDQLDLDALWALLECGHIRSALLDVFPKEPLPSDHPLWRHSAVRITPHVAAETLKSPAAQQIAAKLCQLEAGEAVAGEVIRDRGY